MDEREVGLKMLSWMKMVGACCRNIVPARDDFGFSMVFGDSRCTLTVNPNTGCLDYRDEPLSAVGRPQALCSTCLCVAPN